MKNKILGWIGVIWGGLLLLKFVVSLLSGERIGGGAYGAGQITGVIFGGLLFLAGLLALRKKPAE